MLLSLGADTAMLSQVQISLTLYWRSAINPITLMTNIPKKKKISTQKMFPHSPGNEILPYFGLCPPTRGHRWDRH